MNKTVDFTIKIIVELLGLVFVGIAVLLFVALISYSPEDPNFIFNENTEIKNLLGIQGSYISDLFFQSLGIVSFLIPFTLFFTGINIFRNKKTIRALQARERIMKLGRPPKRRETRWALLCIIAPESILIPMHVCMQMCMYIRNSMRVNL